MGEAGEEGGRELGGELEEEPAESPESSPCTDKPHGRENKERNENSDTDRHAYSYTTVPTHTQYISIPTPKIGLNSETAP